MQKSGDLTILDGTENVGKIYVGSQVVIYRLTNLDGVVFVDDAGPKISPGRWLLNDIIAVASGVYKDSPIRAVVVK